jgi:8-hydroxy-5-deazaflavin:NADPH oxidoreductase
VNIAIIGTGNVGQALGTSFVRAGHDVTFAARDADHAKQVAASVGASAAATPAEAAERAQVIVLAVPYVAAEAVANELAGRASGKIVIDPTNPLKPDYSGLVTENGPSGAENIAGLLHDARVVKAFNTIFAGVQADPRAHGMTLDALFATDDDDARAKVTEIIRSVGFRPIDAGPLARAREMEALAWMNIQLQMRWSGDWRTSFVLVGAPPAATTVQEEKADHPVGARS